MTRKNSQEIRKFEQNHINVERFIFRVETSEGGAKNIIIKHKLYLMYIVFEIDSLYLMKNWKYLIWKMAEI